MKKKVFDCSVKLERILEQNMFAKGSNFDEKLTSIKDDLSSAEYKYISYVVLLKDKILSTNYEPDTKEFENVVKILKYFASKSFQSTSTVLGCHQLDFEKKLNEFYEKIKDEFGIIDPGNLIFIKDFFCNETNHKQANFEEIFKTILICKDENLQSAAKTFKDLTEQNLKAQVFIKAQDYDKVSAFAYFYFYLILKLKEFKIQNKQTELLSLKQVCLGFFNQDFIIINDLKVYNFFMENDADFYTLNFTNLLRDVELDSFFNKIYSFLEQNFISLKMIQKESEDFDKQHSFFSKQNLTQIFEKYEVALVVGLIISFLIIFTPKSIPIIKFIKPFFCSYAIVICLVFAFIIWSEKDEEDFDESDELNFKLIRPRFVQTKNARLITTLFFVFLSIVAIGVMAKFYILSFLASLAIFMGIYFWNMLIKKLDFLDTLDEVDATGKILLLLYVFSASFIALTLLLHPVAFFIMKI